jgi:hypothetical protein
MKEKYFYITLGIELFTLVFGLFCAGFAIGRTFSKVLAPVFGL